MSDKGTNCRTIFCAVYRLVIRLCGARENVGLAIKIARVRILFAYVSKLRIFVLSTMPQFTQLYKEATDSGGNVSNCCMARILPREVELM